MTRTPFDILDQLVQLEVPLVIIGGHAVIHHGYVRATEDLDIVFQRKSGVSEKLYKVLSGFHAFYLSDEVDPKTGLELEIPITLDFVRAKRLMLLGTDCGYLDLFDFVPGLEKASVEEVIGTCEWTNGRPFVNLHWLRQMKVAASRPQDLLDMSHLPTCDGSDATQ